MLHHKNNNDDCNYDDGNNNNNKKRKLISDLFTEARHDDFQFIFHLSLIVKVYFAWLTEKLCLHKFITIWACTHAYGNLETPVCIATTHTVHTTMWHTSARDLRDVITESSLCVLTNSQELVLLATPGMDREETHVAYIAMEFFVGWTNVISQLTGNSIKKPSDFEENYLLIYAHKM